MSEFAWESATGGASLVTTPTVAAFIRHLDSSGKWRLRLNILAWDTHWDPRLEECVKDDFETLEDAKRFAEERIVLARLEGKI